MWPLGETEEEMEEGHLVWGSGAMPVSFDMDLEHCEVVGYF